MAFEGTLEAFCLADVLRLLAATRKTGCVHIEGDHSSGSVWVDGGELVAASADGVPQTAAAEEVIFELLRSGRGAFSFVIGDPPQEDGRESQDVDQLLGQAAELLDEWRDLQAVVPSSTCRVGLIPEIEGNEVTVDARLWSALVAVASGGTIADVGQTLELGELGVARVVRDLVELGVVTVETPVPRPSRRVTPGHRGTPAPAASAPSVPHRWVSQPRP